MATFVIYRPVPDKQINKDAKELLRKSEEFFKANPRRRVASVGVWYGKTAKIRKSHIKEDVAKAVAVAKQGL